jgi:(p)ppGpp synthase/HD superfamily hydrolase
MKNIIVVTGGAGFVGSNLIEDLIGINKYKILSLDNYSSGKSTNHIHSSNLKYLRGDTKNISTILGKYKNKIHTIFHFGEFARIFQSFKRFKECFNSNVEGSAEVLVKLARCCTPVPGDEIMGFITRGSGVSVHRFDCVNADDLRRHQLDRVVKVQWLSGAASIFLVNIVVEALDRPGLLSDVTRILSEEHVNILTASVTTAKDRTAVLRFTFEMADAIHLDTVLVAVRRVEGVYEVARSTNN